MATVIGDVFTDSSRFHTMIARLQHHNSHDNPARYEPQRSASRSRDVPSETIQKSASPRRQSSSTSSTCHTAQTTRSWEAATTPTTIDTGKALAEPAVATQDAAGSAGASRFPSPPSSSSSSSAQPCNGTPAYTTSADPITSTAAGSSAAASHPPGTTSATVAVAEPARAIPTIPSPDSDTGAQWQSSESVQLERPAETVEMADAPRQTVIHIRDLAHIQSLARAELLGGNGSGLLGDRPLQEMKYEISGMPIGDIIEMVAALLTKITTNNDSENKAHHRNAAHMKQIQAQAKGGEDGSENTMSPLASSVLAFHGKNIPAITILSYLSRIHKYCPTTYEVFLSLLVYFDRMSERVNRLVIKNEEVRQAQLETARTRAESSASRPSIPAEPTVDVDTVMRDDESENSDESDSDLADDDDDDDSDSNVAAVSQPATPSQAAPRPPVPTADATFFVVDSFNIHRLIIAGVTCASKFFSDVFYTNSRYAKVSLL
jgi:PHO85 cyclin-6/7